MTFEQVTCKFYSTLTFAVRKLALNWLKFLQVGHFLKLKLKLPSKPDDRLVNLAAAFKIDSSDKFSAENTAPDPRWPLNKTRCYPTHPRLSNIFTLLFEVLNSVLDFCCDGLRSRLQSSTDLD